MFLLRTWPVSGGGVVVANPDQMDNLIHIKVNLLPKLSRLQDQRMSNPARGTQSTTRIAKREID